MAAVVVNMSTGESSSAGQSDKSIVFTEAERDETVGRPCSVRWG